jgi:hypothetical protein
MAAAAGYMQGYSLQIGFPSALSDVFPPTAGSPSSTGFPERVGPIMVGPIMVGPIIGAALLF